MKVVSEMKVVFSNRYKLHAKIVIDEVIKHHGSASGYKEQAWGEPCEADQVIKIVEQYLNKFKLDVNFFFGKSLVTTMSGSGLSLVKAPRYYRDIRLKSLLDHEIGTHHLRSENMRTMDQELKDKIKENRIGW